MLPRSQRLTSAQFDRAFAHNQSVRHPLLALRAHRCNDDSGEIRAAFVVPKKQGRATQRNRTRRRVRERYRLMSRPNALAGCDLIFLTTPATHGASTAEIDAALQDVIKRIGRKLGDSPQEKSKEKSNATAAIDGAGLTPSSNLWAAEQNQSEPPAARKPNPASMLALSLIGFYQRFISPGLPASCRFYPSCSRYTYGAIERFGLGRGLLLGAHRVCRCHPWHAGGLEPVPDSLPPLRQSGALWLAKLKDNLARRGAPKSN